MSIGQKTVNVDGKEYELNWGGSHLSIKGSDAFMKVSNARLSTMLSHMTIADIVRLEIKGTREQSASGQINRPTNKWHAHR